MRSSILRQVCCSLLLCYSIVFSVASSSQSESATTIRRRLLRSQVSDSHTDRDDNHRELQSNSSFTTPSFSGLFTLVVAGAPLNATIPDITLGNYKSGDMVNIRGMPTSMSLFVDVVGDYTQFRSVTVQMGTTMMNDTLYPYALGASIGNQFKSVNSLPKSGVKNLVVTGYDMSGQIIAQRAITFTIVNITVLPPPPPITSGQGKWIVTSPNAVGMKPRHEACFVMVGRVGVFLGGRGVRKPNIYNPVTRTWKSGASVPNNIEINHFQCVVVQGKVWVVGAWTGKFPREQNVNYTYVYDPTLNTWELKDPMPIERRRGAAASVAVGNLIYVAFGNIGGHETSNFATSLNWFDVYDTVTGTWTVLPDATYPRDHTGGALVGFEICVAAGRDGGTVGWPLVTPTECYNLLTNTWSIKPDIPRGRAGSAYGRSCDGLLLVAGGELYDQGIATNNFDAFDGTSWTSLPPLNIARHSTGLAVDCLCQAIYIASGSGAAGSSMELPSVETYFLSGNETKCEA